MQPTLEEPINPRPPISRYGQLEVDMFCTGCHYNLHGQPVSLDERLGFPVCRCPECGRFHPAGVGVTASSIWVRRWATILLFTWIWIVLGATTAIFFTMGAISTASIEMFADGRTVTPKGQTVIQSYNNGIASSTLAGTNTAVTQTIYAEFPRPWHGVTDENRPGIGAMAMLCAFSLLLGILGGTLCVTLLWHWPRRRYLLLGLLPLIDFTVLALVYTSDVEYSFMRTVALDHLGFQSALQSVAY